MSNVIDERDEVNVQPVKCIEKLPATKTSRHNGIEFTPAEEGPDAGILTIDIGRRSSVTYALTEFPTGWDGRGFTFVKLYAESPSRKTIGDKEETSYSVFVARNGQDHQCECKGHAYTGSCKHVAAIQALIENRWI